MYERAGTLVVAHEMLRDELIADFSVAPGRIHVIPLPAPQSDARDPGVDRADRPMFLLFGSLRRNKGIEVLLDAVERLGPELDWEVVIAGHGTTDYEDEIANRAATLLSVTTEFGFVSDERKRELYSAASAVLLPYTSFHSQSAVLTDAYSYRLPVIASDVGALGPTVRAHATGIVCPPGDVTALAQAMLDFQEWRVREPLVDKIEPALALHDPVRLGPMLRRVYDSATEQFEPRS